MDYRPQVGWQIRPFGDLLFNLELMILSFLRKKELDDRQDRFDQVILTQQGGI